MNHATNGEPNHCPDCNSPRMRCLFTDHDKTCELRREFSFYKCDECGLISCFPRLDLKEVEAYYPNAYYAKDGKLKPPSERKDIRSFWFLRDIKKKSLAIRKYKKHGRLLDIGCSTGNFLYGMSLGDSWEIYGLEPDALSVEYIQTWHKFPVVLGTLEDAQYPEQYFDVITMWHVLEHVPDPRKLLLTCKKLLKSDGLLVVEVPNPDSLDAKVFGSAWVGYGSPGHYYSFPAETLRNLARQSGLEVMEICPSTSHPVGSLILSLSRKFGKRLESAPWRQILRVFGSGVGSLFTLPFFSALRSLGYIPSLTYFMTPR